MQKKLTKFNSDSCKKKTNKQKTLRKLGIEGNCLNLIKNIYKNPTANIILTGENEMFFPLRLGIRQGHPLSPFLFNIVLEFLTNVRQDTQIGKKEIKYFVCRT